MTNDDLLGAIAHRIEEARRMVTDSAVGGDGR
jgi:hypothetical protein